MIPENNKVHFFFHVCKNVRHSGSQLLNSGPASVTNPNSPYFFWGVEVPNMINVQYDPLIVWPRQPLNYTAQFEGSELPKAFKLLMINCEEAL